MDVEKGLDEELAIVGMTVRAPGSSDISEFWNNLVACRCGLAVDEGRTADAGAEGWVYSSGNLDGVDQFDAEFFSIPSAEAAAMDPQQRLFIQSCYHALEAAGYARQVGRPRTGVFASSAYVTYEPDLGRATDHLGLFKQMLARDKDFLATRVSYLLGLSGPSVNVQTACSSSLAAVHFACQSLLAGECDLALAGGVSVALPQHARYRYVPEMIFSRDGYCRPFEERSSGTVLANGLGVVVLSRLDDAIARGDDIIAVIKGSAIGNDAHRKATFTSPSRAGQVDVLRDALRAAQLSVDSVGYIEAHGTATKLGDAIELDALTDVYATRGAASDRIALGSAKANVGHLNTAAGVVGMIKAALMIRNRTLVGMPGYAKPNPLLQMDRTPFDVCSETRPWPAPAGAPLVAGVSSFGIGGTNVHVMLSSAPAPLEEAAEAERPQLYVVSGKTPESHRANLQAQAEFLCDSNVRWAAASSAALSRELFAFRTAVVARGAREAGARLLGVACKPRERSLANRAGVVLVFPDICGLSRLASRQLCDKSEAFCAAFDECCAIIRDIGGVDLRHGAADSPSSLEPDVDSRVHSLCQQYALYRFWKQLGLAPALMIGRGAGRLAALVCAGALPLVAAVTSTLADPRTAGAGVPASGAAHIPVVLERAEGVQPSEQVSAAEPSATGLRLFLGAEPVGAAEAGPGTGGMALSSVALDEPWEALLETVAELANVGLELDLAPLRSGRVRASVQLPSYVFERHRHWRGGDATDRGVERSAEPKPAASLRQTLQAIIGDVCGGARTAGGGAEVWSELGVESLAAVEIVERIRGALGVELDVLSFFDCRHFDGLCVHVEAEMAKVDPSKRGPEEGWLDPGSASRWSETNI